LKPQKYIFLFKVQGSKIKDQSSRFKVQSWSRLFWIVAARFGHLVGHHAARILPIEVGMMNFRTAYMCSKEGGKASKRGFRVCILHLKELNFDTFCPISEVRHLGCRWFADIVFHCFFAF
jgi:hypothetical protein